MPIATDVQRLAKAHTPLGAKLFFREMSGREELSRPFEYRVEVWAEDDYSVDPKAVLGRGITIEIETQGGGTRYIDGQCTRFAYVGTETGRHSEDLYYRYEARLSAWIWYMGLQSNSRVFQWTTVPDILRTVLATYSEFSVEFNLTRDYREWEYCVQYQETDLNFLSRLCEHEGIYYYFRHEMSRHTLVLCDDMGAHSVLPGYGRLPHMSDEEGAVADEEHVRQLRMAQEVDAGFFYTRDYDLKHPSADLTVTMQQPRPFPHGSYEIFDYPGGYVNVQHGEQYARIRIEELQHTQEDVTGQTTARGMAPGYRFNLDRCPRRDQNREYLIRSVDLYFRDNPPHSGAGTAEWLLTFLAQPTTFPYRPPRLTPKPRTTGPQTAVVVGLKDQADEEIVCDEYGRVRVQFYWDREHDYNEESSCWMRVSSAWAGNNWGQISIPRVGQEVIVDFLNGDPDYPIIIGRVYNNEHKTPYVLPRWKEYSTIKSRSTKHGGNNDWNEIRFYDYKGKEQVFIHCQWRMDVRVKWAKYETVKESSHFLVGHSLLHTCGGEYDLYAGGDIYSKTKGATYSASVSDLHVKAGGNSMHHVTAGKEINARSVIIEAAKSVTLKCAGSFIEVSPMGITIQGPLVRINSGGAGDSTGPMKMGDPLHASECDTGEPGYLDRHYHGGGGGGSRWSTDDGYHSREVTYDPADGSFTYGGSGIKVKGDPDFADKTLKTLGGLDSTPTGKKLIDNLQDNGKNGKVVTIEQASHQEAVDSGGGVTQGADGTWQNGFPPGPHTFTDTNGNPFTVNSDGSGTSSTVRYEPGFGSKYTDPSTNPPGKFNDPDDETLLGHELIHADHDGKGTNLQDQPDPKDPTGNQEESQTIGINDHKGEEVTENNLMSDLGKDFHRTDHDSHAAKNP